MGRGKSSRKRTDGEKPDEESKKHDCLVAWLAIAFFVLEAMTIGFGVLENNASLSQKKYQELERFVREVERRTLLVQAAMRDMSKAADSMLTEKSKNELKLTEELERQQKTGTVDQSLIIKIQNLVALAAEEIGKDEGSGRQRE